MIFVSGFKFDRAIKALHSHLTRIEINMSALDDAVVALSQAITDLDTAVGIEVTALKAAIDQGNDVQTAAAADAIKALTAKVAADTAALSASVAPAPVTPAST
jgi:hypothetical protein